MGEPGAAAARGAAAVSRARKPPNIQWIKDHGKEPERTQEQFPWFWENGTFKGDPINDYHLTNTQKRAAREKANHR